MNSHHAALAVLIVLAASSAWILHDLEPELLAGGEPPIQVPDLIVENFVTTVRDEEGRPTQRIEAVYMAHFPENRHSGVHLASAHDVPRRPHLVADTLRKRLVVGQW